MTDCKGGFGFGYELESAGFRPALGSTLAASPGTGKSRRRHDRDHVGGTPVNIVGYGCGDDTAATGIKETRRLMEQRRAQVMVGPLSGDEAVAIANYAKAHPTQTFIIGTAGSQDPTMQIAPKNMFRYHSDGAQWNAGVGEIATRVSGGATPPSSSTTTASAGRPPPA